MSVRELRDLGIEVNEHAGKVVSLRIDWTPRQWIDTLNREGPWLDNSLSSAHAIRCMLTVALYEDGWVTSDALVQLVEALRVHRDELFEAGLSNDEYLERRAFAYDAEAESPDEQNPFVRLADIWHAAKDSLVVAPPTEFADVEDFDTAVMMLSDGLARVRSRDLHPRAGAAETQRQLLLSRLLPALNRVHESIREAAPPEVEGYAIVDSETRIPLRTKAGLAIFGDQQQIDEVLPMWRRQDRNIDKKIAVVPCTVSDKGFKIRAA